MAKNKYGKIITLADDSILCAEWLSQMTIDLADALFNIDPLNEKALNYQIKAMQRLKMSEEAVLKYQTFAIEYEKAIGKSFPHSFKHLS